MFLCKLVFWYFGVSPWNLSFYRKGDVGWNGGCLHTRVMAARERARKRTFYAAYGPNLGGGTPVLEILAWTGAKQGGCTTVEPNVESAHCQHYTHTHTHHDQEWQHFRMQQRSERPEKQGCQTGNSSGRDGPIIILQSAHAHALHACSRTIGLKW